MPGIATIGVYGFSADRFPGALRAAGVSLVVDVRQRRGVRGAEYAWANSVRLQAALAEAGIRYSHRLDLAPTTELRHVQYRADALAGVGKRSRVQLATEYADRYPREILDLADLGSLAHDIAGGGAALLCVERDARTCHRSLIADRLERDLGMTVVHLQ